MKKIILNIFLFLILSNCGYSPLLIRNIQDFNIQIEVIEGAERINDIEDAEDAEEGKEDMMMEEGAVNIMNDVD